MAKLFDTERAVQRTIELVGGIEQMRSLLDAEFGGMRQRWDQDVEAIGRILRSHLYVEHYLSEYLEKANPRLGSIKKARLSFAQKLELLDPSDAAISDVLPGIKHLNTIRNRLAHNLSASVTEDDAAVFLNAKMFDALRNEGARPSEPSKAPLDVLESFAQHAVARLSNQFSQFGKAFNQALQDICD